MPQMLRRGNALRRLKEAVRLFITPLNP